MGGVDVAERPVAARREVGYLPEQVTLYPDLTVRRYLRFVAGMKGLDGRGRARAPSTRRSRAAASAGVADRLTGKLSKGYRQRVGLAQALLGDPTVLVLDEPTVGLDPVQTVEMRGPAARRSRGRTVLLSTHILREAAALVHPDRHPVARARSSPRTRRRAWRRGSRERSGWSCASTGPPTTVAAALGGAARRARRGRRRADGEAGHRFVVRARERRAGAARGRGAGRRHAAGRCSRCAPRRRRLEDLFVRAVR